jgi:single-strand DNA-binding protein
MSSFRQITIMGNVGKDPEVRKLDGGAQVGSFSVAVSEKFKKKDGSQQEKTTWFRCDAWQQTENGLVTSLIMPYIKKGQSVFVQGTPEIEEYEKDGVKKQSFKIRLGGPGSTLRLNGSPKGASAGGVEGSPSAPAAVANEEDIPF